MRILVVTNLYPPQHIGGYELGCRDVVEALRARGHEIQILTSTFRQGPEDGHEQKIERTLHFASGAREGRPSKLGECLLLARAVRRHRPEVIYFWNQAGLVLWLPIAARALGCRVAFFLSDTNFVSWRIGAFLARWSAVGATNLLARAIRRIFGRTVLLRGWPVMQNQACHFASRFLQTCAGGAGIRTAPETSVVAHWGIDLRHFAAPHPPRWPIRRLLYAGQLIPQKGVHTAIVALAIAAREPGGEQLHLTIVGGGLHPIYEESLRALPAQLGIGDRVQFLGKVARSSLPEVYAAHDALIFPSEWEEPFAITPLEAMASGLPVVGTATGGSGELLHDRETAMVFTAGSALACAEAIRVLMADRQLQRNICAHAARAVAAHHTLARMADDIESALHRLVAPR